MSVSLCVIAGYRLFKLETGVTLFEEVNIVFKAKFS